MTNPYENLPADAYWRTGVAARGPLDPGALYRPKFPISKQMQIATAGSCFAQHVGRTLKASGFNVMDAEPLPTTIDGALAQKFGFGLYSARHGNIYTARQLLQLVMEALGRFEPEEAIWERDGRYFDALRPSVEPGGLDSPELVADHRAHHLARVRRVLTRSQLLVFTFGLTEGWVHRSSGTVYPTSPGVIAGSFDPDVFEFKNFTHSEVLSDFLKVRSLIMKRNPDCNFLVTTSPVPLTATASGQHVEVATAYSKSVLRAVCGELFQTCENVDYFPSYEIITSLNNRGIYFEANKRSVSPRGVATAMSVFLRSHGIIQEDAGPAESAKPETGSDASDVVCEEALLEAFAK